MICFDNNRVVYSYANVVSPDYPRLDKHARKHICVAIKRASSDDSDHLYYGAFSFCNPGDQFVKKIARTISSNRLHLLTSNDKVVCSVSASSDTSFLNILKEMFASPTFDAVQPNWLRNIMDNHQGVIVDCLGNELKRAV